MFVLTSSQMAFADKTTIEKIGIPGTVLMESAGRGVVQVFLEKFGRAKTTVICGKGNNGGDGLVVSRYLHLFGIPVKVFLLGEPKEGTDAHLNLKVLERLGVEVRITKDLKEIQQALGESEVLVDAIFGTGLAKPVEGFYKEVIEVVNCFEGSVLAVDIPSGLSGSSPEIIGSCVCADVTVTFAYPKVPHVFPPACKMCGEVFVVNICVPPVFDSYCAKILSADELEPFPPRTSEHHKYSYGHVAIVGGSLGKSGAVCMACKSALKVGAGLVSAVVPSGINQVVESSLVEGMTFPVGKNLNSFDLSVLDEVLEFVESDKISAVVVGPGIGKEGWEFAREFVKRCSKRMVIDADGINALVGFQDILKDKTAIITPHVGEFVRISGFEKNEVLKSPWESAKRFSQEFGVVVVLKSGRTVIADENGAVWVNILGNAGMATAGSGDVLSGVIGGLLGMGLDLVEASKLGVFLHSLSGDICARELTEEFMTATDIINFLSEGIKKLKERKETQPKLIKPLREFAGV